MDNLRIAKYVDEVAGRLAGRGENPYRVTA